MLHALVSTASRWVNHLSRSLLNDRVPVVEAAVSAPPPRAYLKLKHVILTDEVARTVFDEFAVHRRGNRGEEETGWVLLGVREAESAVVLATLPAGAERNAGVAHVRFNASAQGLASRIVRQWDRRLTMVGVVHTHPGSLRHPSDGDFQGDSLWVGQLRGKEGIFGIGTADGEEPVGHSPTRVAWQPKSHVQCLGNLRLSWYALGVGDAAYRPLPLQLTLGPDLARPLHPVWDTIENFAGALERLCRQQAGMTFELVQGREGPALAVHLQLAQPGNCLRLLLEKKQACYYWIMNNDLVEVAPKEDRLDRAVYLILAELAGKQ
jgi:proteasome lid subunit RPN8/RPN11